MHRIFHLAGCLLVIGMTACASNTRYAVNDVSLGMTPNEVLALAGDPVASERLDAFRAWRYEYRVPRSNGCIVGNEFGPQAEPCGQVCEHTTVWFRNDEVRSMTSLRVDSLDDCGSGSTPIFWEHMPDYVRESGSR